MLQAEAAVSAMRAPNVRRRFMLCRRHASMNALPGRLGRSSCQVRAADTEFVQPAQRRDAHSFGIEELLGKLLDLLGRNALHAGEHFVHGVEAFEIKLLAGEVA